jgi:CheY-like chemotaxis protein
MLEPAASQRSIRMLFPQDNELSVIADRIRLRQVVLNLLSNAIKYNRERGAVVVDCSATDAGRIRLSVQDTGSGLRPEQLQALFQPFNRLGQESGGQEGTGIGLVVTKRLVELMGGEIGVTSTAGIGSVFWIELKAAEGSSIPKRSSGSVLESTQATDGSMPTLLHIEDNPANLKLVDEIVRHRGDLRQLSVPDAQLGIEIARAHLPQVILMDINLPGLSGKDALTILRSDPRTAHIPVIAVTANAMPRDVAQGLAAGFMHYITKPIDLEALNAAIDRALELSARRSQ